MKIEEIFGNLALESFPCQYCDVRIEDVNKVEISYKNGDLDRCDTRPSVGAFVRVLENDTWFYAATTQVDQLDQVIVDLIAGAEKFPKSRQKTFGSKGANTPADFRFEAKSAPRTPLREKRDACESYQEILASYPLIRDYQVLFKDQYKKKYFKSSSGTSFAYDYNELGIAFKFTLADGDSTFQDRYQHFGAEWGDMLGLHDQLRKDIEESTRFLAAETIEPGKYPVVMASPVVGIFAHESFGHKSESDFMLGDPAALEEWKIGTKVGSEILSIVDCGDHEGTSGYCPYDDEGTPASKTYLIKNGILTGRLHSQSTAHAFSEEATGNARAVDFEFEPIVRMTSTYVEPGPNSPSFDEMISGLDGALYIPDIKYGTGLSTFTIAPARAYWIENGKIATPVRVSVISGSVFQTLNDVIGVSREFTLNSSAIGGCGKMEQVPLPVAFGGPAVLVNNIQAS